VELAHAASSPAQSETAAPLSPARAQAEQRAEQLACELSVLGGPSAAGCAGGWGRTTGALASTGTTVATVAAVLGGGGAGGQPNDGDPGGTAGGERPMIPAPGPAPGGAGGGVAAGAAGGGAGLSGFLTFAALQRLAAPHALRRLRLSSRPYLTAFFVLIPERPG
jgi:hypothetical protein